MIARLLLLILSLLPNLCSAIRGPPQAPTFNPDGKRIGKDLFASHEAKIKSFYNSYIPKHESGNQDLIRVVSWNVHMLKDIYDQESNWKAVVDDIHELNPDIVVMQEIPIDGGIVRLFEKKLHEMGYDGQFKAFSNDPKAQLGIMIASRYPIFETDMLDLGDLRVLANAKIDIGLEEGIHILGTHLEVSSSQIRQKEMQQIRDYIQQKGYQMFMLVGDFNAKWDSPEIKILRQTKVRDSFKMIQWDAPNYTCWSGSRIDFMFLGPDVKGLNGTFVYHGSTSDHLPLIADVWVRDEVGAHNMIHLALFLVFFILLLYIILAYFAPPSTWNRAYQYIEGYDDD